MSDSGEEMRRPGVEHEQRVAESGPRDQGTRTGHLAMRPELRAKLARLFLDVYPAWVEKIRAALAAGDAVTVVETAHTLKGSVSHFDAATSKTAARLEAGAKAN